MRLVHLLALSVVLVAAEAGAAPITFSGSGQFTRALGALAPTATTPVGSPVAFDFRFDPAAATLFEQSEGEAVYDLSLSGFSATLGGYDLPLSSDPNFTPTLVLVRGFTFFGQPFSEPSISALFYFASPKLDAASTATPFALSAGSYGVLEIGATFRDAGGDPLVTIAALRDPAEAAFRTVTYSARDVASGRRGQLIGSFQGGFALAASVPEPATWAVMTLGFGAVGGAARVRRRREGARAAA